MKEKHETLFDCPLACPSTWYTPAKAGAMLPFPFFTIKVWVICGVQLNKKFLLRTDFLSGGAESTKLEGFTRDIFECNL